jgi:YVTN family beta-propeller protein
MRNPVMVSALLACVYSVIVVSGCKNPTSPQNGGFTVTTGQVYQNSNGDFSPPQPVPAVPVAGIWARPDPNSLPQGSVTTYGKDWNYLPNMLDDPFTLNDPSGLGSAYYFVQNGEAPGYWNHRFTFNFYCGDYGLLGTGTGHGDMGVEFTTYSYYKNNQYTFLQTGTQDNCYYYYNGVPGIPPASTRFAIVGQQPQTLTLTGQSPIMTQFGMPLLYIYDGNRHLVDTVIATSVNDDRTQASFPFPSSLSSNAYSLALVNQTNTAPGISTAGTNLLSIASSQTIAGSPFGVAAQSITQSWQSADNSDPYNDGTCVAQWVYDSGTYTYALPIVTQYSLNSVNNGGVTISVGPNPTAIALYDSEDNTVYRNNGPCHSYERDTTQMARAIVANSGSNTVSVVDLVNNVALSTITVGNQPVALAVSPDESTAYVANYTDSTVTQVNLNSGTATATVAVGGQPNSVALTAAGTLWVGGAGFLTQMNAQSMSVVATQPVIGKAIVALGFSNSVNQLVATTVDTGGNVYADNISPSSVQAGGVYTPLASNMVSSVGTHSGRSAAVRAFTATLASSNVISANQVGAPPLVVQDGWAVVTATPTGFTITDITGQVVLVSETTPSPVTAIALDFTLHAAYLVMPDSNILLTVPLPGTN